jgi:hypothetical protein
MSAASSDATKTSAWIFRIGATASLHEATKRSQRCVSHIRERASVEVTKIGSRECQDQVLASFEATTKNETMRGRTGWRELPLSNSLVNRGSRRPPWRSYPDQKLCLAEVRDGGPRGRCPPESPHGRSRMGSRRSESWLRRRSLSVGDGRGDGGSAASTNRNYVEQRRQAPANEVNERCQMALSIV